MVPMLAAGSLAIAAALAAVPVVLRRVPRRGASPLLSALTLVFAAAAIAGYALLALVCIESPCIAAATTTTAACR